MIVTLDGPAGSGKSTTARALAKKLGALYLDTGAMYRAVTLKAIQGGVEPTDRERLEKISSEISIDFRETNDDQLVLVDGVDRTLDIRRPEVEKAVSAVSSHAGVRERMVALQRKIASSHPKVVVEGRDTGSVVFPNADYKFYLSASPEVRAARRGRQNEERGTKSGDVIGEINKRDAMDSGRAVSPLVVPPGGVELDNSNLSLDETIQKIIDSLV
ncbi:MAG: (d)CMP kinase [Nitrospinae bacterium]|nr:(d)CMP kinase [Nitrospinota bacterium]